MYFLKCIFLKCFYPKCIFAKCTRLACLLSFASLFWVTNLESVTFFLGKKSGVCNIFLGEKSGVCNMTRRQFGVDTSYGNLSPSHVASHSFHPHLPQQKITIINTKKDKNTKRLTHKKTNTNTKTNR